MKWGSAGVFRVRVAPGLVWRAGENCKGMGKPAPVQPEKESVQFRTEIYKVEVTVFIRSIHADHDEPHYPKRIAITTESNQTSGAIQRILKVSSCGGFFSFLSVCVRAMALTLSFDGITASPNWFTLLVSVNVVGSMACWDSKQAMAPAAIGDAESR
jgi:hypothetical protein